MPTRMERYYKADIKTKQRTKKNANLYRDIYEETEYSNIEGITTIEKTNEIDIRKIKELLKQQDYQNNKDKTKSIKPDLSFCNEIETPEENKNYDIREILSKAKEEKPEENKYRSLSKTKYDILKSLKLNETISCDECEKDEHELKELINTITSTSVINKMANDELSLGLLSDLKSNGNTTTINRTINEILKAPETVEKTAQIDKSFFTSSLNFKENDFEEVQDMRKTIKKEKGLVKVLVTLLIVVGILIIAFIVYYFFIRK